MSNESESKTKYCYYVSVDKTFDDSDDIHDYILGAWEDKMPASTAKYWSGTGNRLGKSSSGQGRRKVSSGFWLNLEGVCEVSSPSHLMMWDSPPIL